MIDPLSSKISTGQLGSSGGVAGKSSASAKTGASSFDEVLKKSLDEVNQLQQDANQAVEDVATGKNDNIAGVMTAMQKADLAFKTLLAIRAKLMEAYEEIKGMQV